MAIDPTLARVEREFKHASPLMACRFEPGGRYLFAFTQDESIVRFDTTSDEKVSLVGHKSWGRGLAFLKETLVSGDYHGKLLWWNSLDKEPKPVRTVEAHDGWIRAVATSPDGKTIATCGNDHLVKLWTADGKPIRTFEGHDCHVYNVAFHPDGSHLVSVDHKGVLKDWDLKAGKCVRDLDAKALYLYDTRFFAHMGGARGIAFDSRSGKVRLAVSGITNITNAFAGVGNPLVILFDWTEGKPKLLKPKDAFQGTGWGVAFHPDDYIVAAGGGSGGRVWFWKGEEPASMHMVTTPTGARDLALNAAGDKFAIAGANGTAYLYGFTPAPKVEKKPAPAKPKK